ncbi:AAA family ATPase [Gillisia sp. M10.2A]|uniref:AAA family ATPase n=1 Tax=Gillisia lutea TaxID=2909668 RepID=A0ABS9EDV5_9FLAO|nr:AAA family ATPase [Gillisia lutea]MCF4101035.1 AAA family ATPase [Gillisia lutea]
MELVALLKHDSENKTSEIINFGGSHFYTVSSEDGIQLSRNENANHLPDFFATDTVLNVSAIVGANGAGKTTFLKNILDLFHSGYGSEFRILIFHEGRDIVFKTNIYDRDFQFTANFDYKIDQKIDAQTIFYSPFLDFKSSVKGVDLSYDATLQEDLEHIDRFYEASSKIIPHRYLLKRNSRRLRAFIISEFSDSIRKTFGLPDDNYHLLTFTRYKIDATEENINFHNTPYGFREYLDKLFRKIRKDADTINATRPEGYSLFQLQKDLMKNYILMDFLCLMVVQMERGNDFLREGKLDEKKLENVDFNDVNSKDLLYAFLENHVIRFQSEQFRVLPVEPTKVLIEEVFRIIDNYNEPSENERPFFDWDLKHVVIDTDTLNSLVALEDEFINEIHKYYLGTEKDGEKLFDKPDIIQGLLNYQPSTRELSSGETALLNLYSRIYDYFKRNIEDLRTEKLSKNYLLFLDEADLGFHPKWKKSFLKSFLEFTQNFFKKIGSSVQLIFTTHDSLTLSDVPNDNIIYLIREDDETIVLKRDHPSRPTKSFGANITDLLANSFFIEDGLIGDFAKMKIHEAIMWIKDDEETPEYLNKEYCLRIIKTVDEPIVKTKLSEMFDNKTKSNTRLELIEKQITELEAEKKKLSEKPKE